MHMPQLHSKIWSAVIDSAIDSAFTFGALIDVVGHVDVVVHDDEVVYDDVVEQVSEVLKLTTIEKFIRWHVWKMERMCR